MTRDETLSAQDEERGFSDKKLKLAGMSYLLGDAAMYAAAAARGEGQVGNKLGAASWFAGGIASAIYGNPSAEKRCEIIAEKLQQHLAQQGVTIPADIRQQHELLHSKSLWQKIENFLYQHPSEALNAGYALGAGLMIKGALPKLNKETSLFATGGKKLATDLWIGALVLAGALGGLLWKEDPNAREKAEGGSFITRTKAWISEKPLRLSSALYTVNNGFLAWKAKEDFSARNTLYAGKAAQPYYFSTFQLASYLFANTMLLLSPRNQLATPLPTEQLSALEEAAARIIAAQPPQLQQAVLADACRYLAAQAGTGRDADTLMREITARLQSLQHSTEAQAGHAAEGWAARETQRKQETTQHALS